MEWPFCVGFNLRRVLLIPLATALFACPQPAQVAGARSPDFKNYGANTKFTGSPAKPRFTNPAELRVGRVPSRTDLHPDSVEMYRQAVTLDAAKGPNFAGMFTIAQWSCGTGCSSMIVVNARTGRLYRQMPFSTLEIINPGSEDYGGLSYRIDSTLLIVDGCTHVRQLDSGCNRIYYKWVPPAFVLLGRVPLPPR